MVVGDFGAEKKIVRKLTLQVQFSPPHAGKGQIPHSPGTEDSQMPGVCPGEGGASLLITNGELKNKQQRSCLDKMTV